MKNTKLLFMLLALMLVAPRVFAQQAVNVQDSLALVNLYDSTNGSEWDNNSGWKKGPVSTWYGVTVADSRVTKLLLPQKNLIDPVPASFGNLKNLNYNVLIIASSTHIIGTVCVPSCFINLHFN